jgi:hypothetical protein
VKAFAKGDELKEMKREDFSSLKFLLQALTNDKNKDPTTRERKKKASRYLFQL